MNIPQTKARGFRAIRERDGWTSAGSYSPPNSNVPKRNSAIWTRDEDADLIKGFLRGMSVYELADKHNRSEGSIRSRIESGRAAEHVEGPAVPYPKEATKPAHKCEFKFIGFEGFYQHARAVYQCDACKAQYKFYKHRRESTKPINYWRPAK